MLPLNARQLQVLDFIRKEVQAKGYPPSVREICQTVGFRSTSSVHAYLRQLEEAGYIRRDPTKPRAIEILSSDSACLEKVRQIPLLSLVSAGVPILAEENIEEYFPIPEGFVHAEELFMLRVKGDSMVGAGIFHDDRILVEKKQTAQNGEIVVALLGDEATVKRFFLEADHVRLQAENPEYPPIVSKEVSILGKVVGVFRRVF